MKVNGFTKNQYLFEICQFTIFLSSNSYILNYKYDSGGVTVEQKKDFGLTMDQITYQKLNYIAKKQNQTVEQILIEMMKKAVNTFEDEHGKIE